MKKLLSILLASVIFISSASIISVSAADNTTETNEITTTQKTTAPAKKTTATNKKNPYKDFDYSVYGNTVTIEKYTGSAKSVTIPSEINGKKVRVIGKSAFRSDETNSLGLSKKNKTLEKVTIPDSVYEIESYAFYKCVNLSKITIGKNIKKIGSYAFYGCKSLKEFKIPSKVTKYTDGMLGETGITTLHFDKNIKKINYYSLFHKKLKKITVSKDNKKFSSKDGVLYNKKQTELLICPRALDKTTLTLPNTVKEIKSYAFEDNDTVKTVILPEGLEKIDYLAFWHCNNLRKITIPKSVVEIDEDAFFNCKKLSKLTILNRDKIMIEQDIFVGCGFKTLVVSHKIDGGFKSCAKLKKITILPEVKTIGYKQFFNCPKLKTVTIPPTVKKIEDKAFGFKYKYDPVKDVRKTLKVKGFTIKGKKNTAAHRYAKKHGFKFVEIK